MKILHSFKSWSKALHILLLMLLAAPMYVSAQETLTVYEGTMTNNHVPAFIFYFDDFTRSQCVFPANALDEMNGGDISSLNLKSYLTIKITD